jgi:hypothetical protein
MVLVFHLHLLVTSLPLPLPEDTADLPLPLLLDTVEDMPQLPFPKLPCPVVMAVAKAPLLELSVMVVKLNWL